MRRLIKLSLILLSSTSACFAQTGFSTQSYTVPRNGSLRSADFNKDGFADLLVFGGYSAGSVLLNNGSGGFLAPVTLPGSGVLQHAQVADMNDDGYPDIAGCVVPSNSTQYNLVIYLNDGTGKFTIAQTTAVTGLCASVNVGDVNQDGHLDVVTTSTTNAGTPTSVTDNIFETFLGAGTGQVGTPIVQQNVDLDSTTANSGNTNCGIVDANGGNFYLDNQYSLIVNTQCEPIGQTPAGYLGTTFLAHGDGTGHYTFAEIKQGNEYLSDGQTFDINKDGRPDSLFVSYTGSTNSNLYYAENNSGGSFTFNNLTADVVPNQPILQFAGATSADFDGDGYNDIATSFTALTNNGSAYYAYVSILSGSSTGAFTQSKNWTLGTIATANIEDIVAADFNNDGKPDFAVLSYNPANSINTLNTYTNQLGEPPNGCNAPIQPNTNVICTPANGSTTGSSFNIVGTSNVADLTLNRVYYNNIDVYDTTSPFVSTNITTGAGPAKLVLVSYNNKGQAFTSTSNFTVGTVCLPSGSGVSICDPTSGETTSSTVTLTAGATAASGNITALRAYIDNVAVATAYNPSITKSYQFTQVVNASPGGHHLVVVGYESTGAALTVGNDFVVNASQDCYPASAGAKICSPAPSAVVNSPVEISAGATTSTGYIAAIRVYVDSIPQATTNNPQQSKSFSIDQPITMPVGNHTLVIVGYPSTGGAYTATESIRVQ